MNSSILVDSSTFAIFGDSAVVFCDFFCDFFAISLVKVDGVFGRELGVYTVGEVCSFVREFEPQSFSAFS